MQACCPARVTRCCGPVRRIAALSAISALDSGGLELGGQVGVIRQQVQCFAAQGETFDHCQVRGFLLQVLGTAFKSGNNVQVLLVEFVDAVVINKRAVILFLKHQSFTNDGLVRQA